MPSIKHHGATIYFEKFGQGFPILTFAPAGLRSAIIDVRNGFSVPVTPQAGRRAGFVEPCRAEPCAPCSTRSAWDS